VGAGGGSEFDERGDPFWLPLGSPRTNERRKSFTPPFPAYPSGHATFGAAAFQVARLFYGWPPDQPVDIAFEFVSAELDGKSTDRNGTSRTRHKRAFDSLWHAIFENGLSRVFLGVHWVDAFAAADVGNPDGSYKDPDQIGYRERHLPKRACVRAAARARGRDRARQRPSASGALATEDKASAIDAGSPPRTGVAGST
jgi:hypothetical protein